MNLLEEKKIVYTAMSKHYFYARMFVSSFTLTEGYVPLNPFNVFGYFLSDLVDRDLVRQGNNNIVRISDEVWIFGPIADGVLAEIEYAIALNKPIKFFTVGKSIAKIKPLTVDNLEFEEDSLTKDTSENIKNKIATYMESYSNV